MLWGRLCQLPISNPWIFPCCRFIEIVDVVTRKMLEEYKAFKYRVAKKSLDKISVISGFHHKVDKNYTLLGHYAVSSGNF